MKQKYLNFIKGVSINQVGKIGMVLTTSSFVTFIFFELLRIAGILTNSYIGLLTYLLLPTLFVIGLILIPIGWFLYRKSTGLSTKILLEKHFDPNDMKSKFTGSRLFNIIAIFTIVNVLFLSIASMRMLSFMDEPVFCGTACHSVMNPEWVTYQQSPHSHVKCVECHVGEGVDALVASKLNGAYQMLSVTFDLLERPIPTPVHNLRPSKETCEKCHWPEKFYGSKLKTIKKYGFDEKNTPTYTTLNMKIDSGTKAGKSGIHWHTSKDYDVTYTSVDDKRQEIIWVDVEDKDGKTVRFKNNNLFDENSFSDNVRKMDCIDCHNRATHIYEDPEKAIDERMASGLIDNSLPFIKKVGFEAITKSYSDKETANKIIRLHVEKFYLKKFPNTWTNYSEKIENAVKVLQDIYNRNIHPEMKIEWGSYPNFIGHKNDSGCFRCHNQNMVSESGETIPYDCTTCHSFAAYDSKTPYEYMNEPKAGSKDSVMHSYLRNEFIKNTYK